MSRKLQQLQVKACGRGVVDVVSLVGLIIVFLFSVFLFFIVGMGAGLFDGVWYFFWGRLTFLADQSVRNCFALGPGSLQLQLLFSDVFSQVVLQSCASTCDLALNES